jgi:hypothetical protein
VSRYVSSIQKVCNLRPAVAGERQQLLVV